MRLLLVTVLLTLASPARAEAPSRADARLPLAVIDRFLSRLVPLSFAVPADSGAPAAESPSRVAIVEARSCGTVDATHGRLLAVIASGTPAPLLRDGDCKLRPAQIAARAAHTIAEIALASSAGKLRLSLSDVAAAGPDGPRLGPALTRARAAGPLATVSTSALPVRTAAGATQTYDLAIGFARGDAVTLAMTPAGRSAPAPAATAPPSPTDAVVTSTYPFANALLALFTRDEPFTLDAQGQAVEVRSLQLEGREGSLTLQGQAQARGIAEVAHLTITAAGADLTISEVRVDAALEDCSGLATMAELGCRARNAARAGAASAAATALTGRYKGTPVRSLTPLPATTFELGGRRFDLRLTPARLGATATGVLVSGKAEVDPG
jgi:hypothetical protein